MTAKRTVEIIIHSDFGELVREGFKSIIDSKWYFVLSAVTLYAGELYERFFGLFEKYIFSDWTFFGYFFVAIILDTMTGMLKTLNNGTFSSSLLLKKLAKKFGMYAVLLIIGNGFSKLVVGEKVMAIPMLGTEPLPIVTALLYLGIYYREADSAIKNASSKSLLGWIKYGLDNIKNIKTAKEQEYEQKD